MKDKQPRTKIKINGWYFSFLIDTGAFINLIDEKTFYKFKIKPVLKNVPTEIFAYGANTPSLIIGLFRAEIESKRRITIADIYVASGTSGSLLSYQTALDSRFGECTRQHSTADDCCTTNQHRRANRTTPSTVQRNR